MNATTTTPQDFQFDIEGPRTEATVRGRAKAVQHAKALSARGRRPVRVTRRDERVRMEFTSGSLVTYRFEPRRRSRR